MKRRVDIVVVIPAGPGTNPQFLADTIESYGYFAVRRHQIILIDDSREELGNLMQQKFKELDVITRTKSGGSMAGLYLSLSEAYKYALLKYDFTLLFKLDSDALITAPAPELEALRLFEDFPNTAIAGQYPNQFSGEPWDIGWPKARIHNGTFTWKFVKRPRVNLLLRKYHLMALKNGYKTGESVFGGAYFMSRQFLECLNSNGLLPHPVLGSANLGEDHIFSLLAKAFGFDLAGLSEGRLPFCCEWKQLPTSPEEIIALGKKIVHSTRGYGGMNEEEVRRTFRSLRTKSLLTQRPIQ